ncbi:hypothetical protein KKG24_03385 [Patescibacteria group bacterium]|nr:hypothetical protein [Patescibacteria group bacterium]
MKINFFKKENNFKKKDFAFHPNFFWKIILISTMIIIFLSLLFGYGLFKQTNEEPILPLTNNDGQFPVVNKDRIEKVLNFFYTREKKSIDILNSSSFIVDPSL